MANIEIGSPVLFNTLDGRVSGRVVRGPWGRNGGLVTIRRSRDNTTWVRLITDVTLVQV